MAKRNMVCNSQNKAYTKVNSAKTNAMVKENSAGIMVNTIMANGPVTKNTEVVFGLLQLAPPTKSPIVIWANGITEMFTVTVFILGITAEASIKASLKIFWSMEEVWRSSKTEIDIKGITRTARLTVTASISGKMDHFIKETS
jgi:hypothetical protein